MRESFCRADVASNGSEKNVSQQFVEIEDILKHNAGRRSREEGRNLEDCTVSQETYRIKFSE